MEEIVDEGKDWQVIKVPRSLRTTLLDEFLAQDFLGWTLIEYKDGFGFDVEWARGKIIKISRDDGIFWETGGRAYLLLTQRVLEAFPPIVFRASDGAWFVDNPGMWCYSFLPPVGG